MRCERTRGDDCTVDAPAEGCFCWVMGSNYDVEDAVRPAGCPLHRLIVSVPIAGSISGSLQLRDHPGRRRGGGFSGNVGSLARCGQGTGAASAGDPLAVVAWPL